VLREDAEREASERESAARANDGSAKAASPSEVVN